MANIKFSIDLLALGGARVAEKDGVAHLVIPIKQADLYRGKKGVYLNAVAWEHPSQFGDSHYIKQDHSKEWRDVTPDGEQRHQPILGNGKELVSRRAEPTEPAEQTIAYRYNDLPF